MSTKLRGAQCYGFSGAAFGGTVHASPTWSGYSVNVDPTLLSDLRLRFGGRLTGAVTASFGVYLGGAPATLDGTHLFSSTDVLGSADFSFDAGEMTLSAPTLVKFSYVSTGTFSMDNIFIIIGSGSSS